jgi:hypothetical protein
VPDDHECPTASVDWAVFTDIVPESGLRFGAGTHSASCFRAPDGWWIGKAVLV